MNQRSIITLLVMFFLSILPAAAQRDVLSGRVLDKENNQPMAKSTLQLYRLTRKTDGKLDTTFVRGVLSEDNGRFTFNNVSAGQYLLKITFLGYKSYYQALNKERGREITLGNIMMEPNSVQLDEAVITANLPKMIIRDDTVVYNADAFRVPEGSVIEALVEALPGAKIDDDGKITINGKEVRKFKMDGRDFMTGNNDAVMKNLPSYVIDQVKAYDDKSDLSRMTGIDDGNDDFTLEFVTKRSARNGIQANPDLVVADEDEATTRDSVRPRRQPSTPAMRTNGNATAARCAGADESHGTATMPTTGTAPLPRTSYRPVAVPSPTASARATRATTAGPPT